MLRDSIVKLAQELREVEECARAVCVSIAEDLPPGGHGDHKVVQDLDEAVLDFLGDAVAARLAIEDTGQVTGRPDADGVATALASAHRHLLAGSRRLRDQILGAVPVSDLRRLTRRWGRPWQAWASVVLTGLADSRAALDRVDETLLDTWTAVVDGAGNTRVSVGSVAQQIHVSGPSPAGEESYR